MALSAFAYAPKNRDAVPARQQPGGRQIGRGIAGAQFAEVDDTAERPVADDHIGGVEIAVEPNWRVPPSGS